MKTDMLLTLLISILFGSCSNMQDDSKNSTPLTFEYPSLSGTSVTGTKDSKTYLIDSQSKVLEVGSASVPSGTDVSGAFISNILSSAGKTSSFEVPDPQTASSADPATGRFTCMISSDVSVKDGGISIKMVSLPTVVRVPVAGIPAEETLVSVGLSSGESRFMKSFLSGCQKTGAGYDFSVVGRSSCATVLTPEVSSNFAFVDICIFPVARAEFLLNGVSSDAVGQYTLEVTTSKGGQEIKRSYPGLGISDADLCGNEVINLKYNGGAFNLSDDFQGESIVEISSQPAQLLHFGVDCERLWYFWDNQREKLCKLAAGDMKVDFARVAINAAYEREEGNKVLSAYTDDIIPLMSLLKQNNPDIKFFASPRPLAEAYSTKTEQDLIDATFKNGDISMYAYPIWVGGNKNILIEEYKKVDKDKMVRYLSDYLNLMHSYGFDIDYMDLVNEDQSIWATDITIILDVIEKIPSHLNEGVKMPLIMFPSTWSPGDGFKRFLDLQSVKDNIGKVMDTIGIICTHNTPDSDINKFDFETLKRFADAIHALDPDKEIWNSEMHAWVGTKDPAADIRNSEILWKHLIAGFSGIDTWLFFGPWSGSGHPMVYSNGGNGPVTTTKYEIFKTVVNEAVQGRFHPSVCSNESLTPAVMIKDNRMVVCLHNLSSTAINTTVKLPSGKKIDGDVTVNLWEESEKDITPRQSTSQGLDGAVSLTTKVPANALQILVMSIE